MKLKKIMLCLLAGLFLSVPFAGCGSKSSENTLTVLDYGKYLDPEAIEMFEEETGITVDYEEYITPENMYTKYRAGAIDYDLICTSDYMIEKLIQEEEVLELDYGNIPLSENIDPVQSPIFSELSASFTTKIW